MGKDVIDVQFDNNPQAVYQPGDVVQGAVIITVSDTLKAEALRVKLSGKAKVRWTEGGGQNTRYYSGSERYIGEEILISDRFATSQELPAGCHTFPFRFQLPSTIPATFTFKRHGTALVYYHIKVVVVKPWALNTTFKKPISVFRMLDLNIQPAAVIERRNRKQKYICCCCCKSGPISGSVHVTREGYVPGDTVIASGEVENLSSRNMKNLFVTLTRAYEFHATMKTRREEVVIQKIRCAELSPGGSYSCRETLTIPTGAEPSFLIDCNIIDIHYYVSVVADPAGCSFDLNVPVEVVVGTIPHASTAQGAGIATSGFASAFTSSGLTHDTVPGQSTYNEEAVAKQGTFVPGMMLGANQPVVSQPGLSQPVLNQPLSVSQFGSTGNHEGTQGYDNYASAFSFEK